MNGLLRTGTMQNVGRIQPALIVFAKFTTKWMNVGKVRLQLDRFTPSALCAAAPCLPITFKWSSTAIPAYHRSFRSSRDETRSPCFLSPIKQTPPAGAQTSCGNHEEIKVVRHPQQGRR